MQIQRSNHDIARISSENNYPFENWFSHFAWTKVLNRQWLVAQPRWMAVALVIQGSQAFCDNLFMHFKYYYEILFIFFLSVWFCICYLFELFNKCWRINSKFSNITAFNWNKFNTFEFNLKHFAHDCRWRFLERLNVATNVTIAPHTNFATPKQKRLIKILPKQRKKCNAFLKFHWLQCTFNGNRIEKYCFPVLFFLNVGVFFIKVKMRLPFWRKNKVYLQNRF